MSWTQKFSDAFTDTQFTALPTHNAAWAQDTTAGTARISANGTSAGCVVNASMRCYITGANAPGNDQAAQYKILGSDFSRTPGIIVRFTDGDNANFWGGTGYVSIIDTAAPNINTHRLDGGGSHTQIAATSYTPASGDVFRVEMVSSQLTVLVNASQIHQVNDATYTTGKAGIWSGLSFDDGSNMSIDDFVAEEWSAAAGGGAIIQNLMIG